MFDHFDAIVLSKIGYDSVKREKMQLTFCTFENNRLIPRFFCYGFIESGQIYIYQLKRQQTGVDPIFGLWYAQNVYEAMAEDPITSMTVSSDDQFFDFMPLRLPGFRLYRDQSFETMQEFDKYPSKVFIRNTTTEENKWPKTKKD